MALGVDVLPEAVQDISETTNLDSNGELPVHRIYLGEDFNDRVVNPTKIQSVVDWKDWYVLPAKGTFGGESTSQGNDATGYYIEYMPYLHAEGSDEFQWTAKGENGLDKNFTCKINLTPSNDDLQVYILNKKQSSSISLEFDEEQNFVAAIEVFDPDPSNGYLEDDESNWPSVTLTGTHDQFFELVPNEAKQWIHQPKSTSRNGWSWTYDLKVSGNPLNFEAVEIYDYDLEVVVEDIIDSQLYDPNTYSITASLVNVVEVPQVLLLSPLAFGSQTLEEEDVEDYAGVEHISYNYTLLEGTDTNITIPFKIQSPNGENLSIRYETDRLKDEDGESILPVLETINLLRTNEEPYTLAEDDSKWGGTSSGGISESIEGNISISFPIADAFCEPTTYRFYVKDGSGPDSIKTDSKGTSIPFLTAKIEIVNDYSDQISLNLVYPSGTVGAGTESDPIFLQPYKENSINIVADFNVSDPDSWAVADLRQDNNASTHQGALIKYNLEWLDDQDAGAFTRTDPEDIFEISTDGILTFKSPPDYDDLYPADLIFKLKVEVSDSTLGNSTEHKRTITEKFIEFSIGDVNEEPLFHDISGKIASAPTFSIKTPEDVQWVWDYTGRDELDQSLFISAKDLDMAISSYIEPEWEVTRQSVLGFVEVSGVKVGQKSKIIVPDSLTFTPFANKTGVDYFELSFGNSEEVVRFDINVTNLPDSPVLEKIVNKRGSTGEISIPIDRELYSYDLNFSETEGLLYEMDFADRQDLDEITELSVVEILDYQLFEFEKEEVDGSNAHMRVKISLKQPQDFENVQDKNFDGIYSLTIKVGDGNLDPLNYTFNFHIQNEDEGPMLSLPTGDLWVPMSQYGYWTLSSFLSVKEEQKIAISGITAADPENASDIEFVWSVQSANDGNMFEVSKPRGDIVDLLFKDDSIPSWEIDEQRELNVTLKIRDTGIPSGVSYFVIPIELADVNDPPAFIETEISISEPNPIIVDDLYANELVFDEDGHDMTFYIEPGQADNSLFEINDGSLVLLAEYSDFEERDNYEIILTVEDEKGELVEQSLNVLIRDIPEPPEVRDADSDNDDILFNDKIVESKTFEILEDEEFIIDSLIFYDPEDPLKDPNNLNYTTIGDYEGTFTVLVDDSGKKNGTFSYLPPQDYYSPPGETIEVDLNISDGTMSSKFTFVFVVEDVPDPPMIKFELDPDISRFDTSDTSLLITNEGFESLAILQADDTLDSDPSLNFDWELRGYDANLFTLQTRLEGKREMFLGWNLSILGGLPPDYGLPPINPKDGKQRANGHKFELEIVVYGDANKDPDSDNRRAETINIEIYDLPEEPPFFTRYSMDPYLEGSDSLFVGTVEAVDPDDAELRLNGKVGNQIHYYLESSSLYSDYIFFDEVKFNTDPQNPDIDPGGELYFKEDSRPDYEALVSSKSGAKYEILVTAKEWDEEAEEYVDGAETEQIIEVIIENKVEKPFFQSLGTSDGDANFTLVEGKTWDSDSPFRVFADTTDFNKNITIILPEAGDFDNDLFHIVSEAGSDQEQAYAELHFSNPPDRESARDNNKDNIYEVELKIETEDPAVYELETFRIEVTDADFPFSIAQKQKIKHPENISFVADLDVADDELGYVYPDLLFTTEKGVFYLSNISMDYADNRIHFSDKTQVALNNLTDVHGAASADLDNDGSSDIVVMSERNAKVVLNSGFGSFVSPVDIYDSQFPGEPRQVILEDFDQDGFTDVLISFTYTSATTESGIYLFKNTDGNATFEEPISLHTLPDLPDSPFKKPISLEVLDVDGDYDLDLIVADFDQNRIAWIENEAGTFTFGGEILSSLSGLSAPRVLRSANLSDMESLKSKNPFLRRDLLVGASEKIFVLRNDGLGNFETLSTIALKKSGSSLSSVRDLRVADLDSNQELDIVYLGTQSDHPYFILQENDGTWTDAEFVTTDIPAAESIEIFYQEGLEILKPVLVVGTSNPPQLYQFEPPNEISTGTIDFKLLGEIKPTLLSDDVGVMKIQSVDLNYAYNFFDFKINTSVYDYEVFDEARFKAQGKLFFNAAPDFESPLSDTDNNYQVEIVVSKKNQTSGDIQTESKLLTIQVQDVNEPPEFIGISSFTHPENFLEVLEFNVSNPESGELLEFEIVSSSSGDAEFFGIDQEGKKLVFKDRIRYEEQREFEIVVNVSDEDGLSDEQTFQIALLDGYEPPVVLESELKFSMEEDQLTPLVISFEDFGVSDLSTNIESGIVDINISRLPSNGSTNLDFTESGTAMVGELKYTPDGNFSGEDELILEFVNKVGLRSYINLIIEILPEDDAPVVRTPLELKHKEGDLNVTLLDAYDGDPVDKNSLTWRMADPDDPNFQIIGKKSLFFRFVPDFETHGKQLFTADLLVSDGEHNVSHSITIQLTDISDEAPSSIFSGSEVNLFKIMEGERLIANLDMADPDGPESPTARVIAGLDSSFFTIIDEELRIRNDINLSYEEPEDINSDNIYEFKVRITDGLLQDDYLVFVQLLDLDENPPFFTTKSSNGEVLETTKLEAYENQTKVGFLSADDIEKNPDELRFKILPGKDKETFVLNGITGELKFKYPPNYEESSDIVGGTVIERPYEIEVEVTDGYYTTTQGVSITVKDLNDLPSIKDQNFTLLEDEDLITTLVVTDEDGEDHLIFSALLDKPVHGSLEFDPSNFSFTYSPDQNYYGPDSFSLLLTDDQGESVTEEINLNISPVNDPPVANSDFYYYFSDENISLPMEFSISTNDHSGPDDSAEIINYTFQIQTAPKGTLQNGQVEGSFEYLPEKNSSLGPDSFGYVLFDNDLNSTETATVWVATMPNFPQWISLRNFGLFYHQIPEDNNAWVYHERMGWVYVSEFSDIYNATWIWHELIGWFWTGDWNVDLSRARWLYSDSAEMWMHWEGGIREKTYWFTRDYEDNIYDEDFFIRLNIRNDIIDILPDISGLVNYLENSNYFTRADIVRIIGELNRFRESSTLDSILEYKLPY